MRDCFRSAGSSLTGGSVTDRLKNPNTIKVLILCHNRPFAGHWAEKFIRPKTEALFGDRMKSENKEIDYFTLDPGETNDGRRADFPHGAVQNLFQVTRFSSVERFDMVWAPDCGGEWFAMWMMTGDAQGTEFVRLVNTMSLSVLPGGFLMLGKLPFSVDKGIELLKDQDFQNVESAPMLNPYDRDDTSVLNYILVQKARSGLPR